MKVLSLFDGLSGAQMALKKLGIVPEQYFASEIDEYAIKITMKNFPDTIQLGSVENWQSWNLPKLDLLIGGSPCQDLSVANSNGKGLDGEKSKLFWYFVDILNTLKPRYFVLENVESMKTKDFVIICNALGVEPIMLDAALVSAQRRKRYFWTNIPGVKKPDLVPSRLFPNNKKGLVIADILEENAVRKQVNVAPERIIKISYGVRWNTHKGKAEQNSKAINVNEKGCSIDAQVNHKYPYRIVQKSAFHGLQGRQAMSTDEKFPPIDATFGKRPTRILRGKPQGESAQNIDEKADALTSRAEIKQRIVIDHNSQQNRAFDTNGLFGVLPAARTTSKTTFVFEDLRIEQLTWTELERLAGLEDGYTDLGSENRVEAQGRAIGNGFQIDIVAHLLSFMRGLPEPLKRHVRVKAEQATLF